MDVSFIEQLNKSFKATLAYFPLGFLATFHPRFRISSSILTAAALTKSAAEPATRVFLACLSALQRRSESRWWMSGRWRRLPESVLT